MRYILSTALIFLSSWAFSQEWEQVANFGNSTRRLYTDTVDQLLYISGQFKFYGNDTINGVCFWNGNSIQPMGDGLYDACPGSCYPVEMFIRYKNEIYTSSIFDEVGGQPSSGIGRWNGSTWLPVSPGLYSDNNNAGTAWGACEHDGRLYVVGPFRTAGQDTANSVASWDGNTWHTYGAPEDTQHDIPLHGRVIFYKDEMYVGGNCYNIVDGNINFDIMRYDGTAWHQVGSGIHGGLSAIFKMVIYHGDLYICGRFDKSSGNAGNGIMRWDGEQWHDVGGGLCYDNEFATDMMVYQDKLYMVGIFSCIAEDLPVSNIAVWNDERWCSLGNSIFDDKLGCIEAYKGEIYVGGGFEEVGGYPVKYLAKYIGDHSTNTCSASVSITPEPHQGGQLTIHPNPVKDQFTITASSGSLALTMWRVFNAAGQEVTFLVHLISSSMPEQWMLDVQGLPVGVYYLQGRGHASMETGRFVKM